MLRIVCPAIALLLLAVAHSPAAGQAGRVVLSGRVVEAGTGLPVAGATATLQGIGTALTDVAGEFVFDSAPPGAHTLVVHAIGYGSAELSFVARADTTVVVRLQIRPVLLDSVGVGDRRISVSGTVRDAETSRPVFDAEVRVSPDREATTNVVGRFRVRRLYAGAPIVVEVRALGYLPHPVALQPDQDTTLAFELRPDSIALRLIAAQEERLKERTGQTPFFPTTVDRDDVLRLHNWTARDLVEDAVGRRRITCLFIDEREITFEMDAQLRMIIAPEVHRIEILRERPSMMMVRVYTRRFFQRTGLTTPLRNIQMVSVPGRVFCT